MMSADIAGVSSLQKAKYEMEACKITNGNKTAAPIAHVAHMKLHMRAVLDQRDERSRF